MSLDEAILSHLSDSGYELSAGNLPSTPDSQLERVSGSDLSTTQPTLGGANPERQSHRSLSLVFVLISVLFIVDLATPGFNFGLLYLVPLSLAIRCRISEKSFAFLTLLLICLVYSDLLWESYHYSGVLADPALTLNRGFAIIAIGICSLIVILARIGSRTFRDSRRLWRQQSSESADRTASSSSKRDTILRSIAAILTLAIFAFDLATPTSLNVPILYLIPLAIITLVSPRILLWHIVVLMLGLSALGYCFASGDVRSIQQVLVIIANRFLAGVGVVLVALLLPVSAKFLRNQGTRYFSAHAA